MRSLQSLENSYRQKRYDRYDSGNMNIRHLLGHRVANRIIVMLIKVQRLIKRQKLIIRVEFYSKVHKYKKSATSKAARSAQGKGRKHK